MSSRADASPVLAPRLAHVRPSATVTISARATALREAGEKVIALSAGESDFATPIHIRRAAIAAIERGETRYTPPDGMSALKAAVAAKFRRENRIAATPETVIVGSGGKQVIFNALLATLGPGDEVVIPAPFWVSYPEIVRFAEAEPVIVPTRPAEGWKLSPEALEAALSERTRWLVLNSPGNPTGAGYGAAELAALAEVLRRHPHVLVLCDDIYEHLAYPPFRFATLAAVAPDLAERVLTVNGVSKAYAMTGWRIGYATGPAWLIGAMRVIQSQSTSNPCTFSQHAALAALEGPQGFLEEWRMVFMRRRDKVVATLSAIEGITCPTPQGAFYVFPEIGALLGRRTRKGRAITDDTAFALALLEEAGVAVVPGAAFGHAGAIRLSYAAADAELEEALARIAEFCTDLR